MPSASEAFLPLADLFARVPPEREALVHGAQRWTFGDLDKRSAQLAAWLIGKGVEPHDLVAFQLPNGPEFLALAFAIYRCGATPAPLSYRLPPAERDAILSVMQPRCAIDVGMLPATTAAAMTLPPRPVAASWKACTSGGSTGTPKVIVDGRPAGFPAGTAFIGIPANSRVSVPGPLYHNAPFSAAVFALWNGSTVHTADRFDAAAVLDEIAREGIGWALMVPTMMHRIMALPAAERPAARVAAWKQVVHTAAPMARWLKQAWIDWLGPEHIWEVYGATEGLVRCWIGGSEWLERPGSVGRPIGNGRIRILRGDGSEAAPGEHGEVFAMPPGGPGSTYRYIGAERRATDDGWESVGDVGWLDPEGYLFLADRKDDLIISGGVNIWPAEVEAAVLRHPDVRSCAVFGKPDADLGAAVHAVIESGAALTLEDLTLFLTDHLARAKHPRSIDVTSQTVRDDAGKFRKPRVPTPEIPA
ncbi:AMP-binding protein [Novosphingobium sp. NDB2Meth1]|uniref:AMP-binding protein n=1 Tax=Novosphingobium sp. NDB2Meth1 TaxID=1892847 RepID=UPI0009306378|nr:AMP-binding protein [Novosphingobium sp. NDB2Meth1]